MKIAVIDTTLDGQLIGGAQTFLPKLLKGLAGDGHDVHLIARGAPNEKVRRQLRESNAVIHTDLWDAHGLVEETAPVLAAWLNELRPDVFVISVSADIGWVVLPLLDPSIASVAIAHSDQETFYLPARHYAPYLTAAVGVSRDICDKFETRSGLDPSRVSWIPYGVEIRDSPVEANSEALQLIYVGRLETEDKRSGDVIGIIKKLRRHEIDYRFRIIGDGSLRSRFVDELDEEIGAGKVEVPGWLESEQVLSGLRSSDVFVLTSESEGFCIAMIEAAGSGCCLLVTDIPGGNQQLVTDGENGFLVPVGDLEGFVDRLTRLSEDRDLLLRMRKNALRSGREFSVRKMVDAYAECFERAVTEATANPRQQVSDFPLMETCRSKYPFWMRKIKARAKSLMTAG